jgi:Tfp pilus assembly protein PilX
MSHLAQQKEKGSILVSLLIFIVAFSIFGIAVGTMIVTTLTTAIQSQSSEKALNAAEAGLNYYLWHMNHDSSDIRDGTGAPSTPTALGYGPYVHDYNDLGGNKIGTFTLYILPGVTGSTTVTVRSIGQVTTYPTATRTAEARIGAPSFSTFAIAGNTALWFGNTESTGGPVHSNVGVKMDGSNTDQVTSVNSSYIVPNWSGNGAGTTKPGVWCDSTVTSPVNCNSRSKTSWSYPVPAVDFNKINGDLCALKKLATVNAASNACTLKPSRTAGYIPPSTSSFSSTTGYLITLNDNGTYNLEKVTNERDTKASYSSALTRTTVATNVSVPSNGVIFVEDNVWVRSAGPNGYDGRVTIASARLASPAGDTSVTIVDDLKYKNKYDGSDSIGIIAEDNVEVAPYVGSTIEIDGALIAQTGSVGIRQKYSQSSNYVTGYASSSNALTFFGSIASNQQWTWSVQLCGTVTSNSCWAGWRYTFTNYDENLRYSPPPSFPVTSSFDILSWREVLTKP